MEALAAMADQLSRAPEPEPPDPNESKAARMRRELRENGGALAKHLAKVAGLHNSGLVGGLLKHDIQMGRVTFSEGRYWWNFDHKESPREARPGFFCETIEWHEVSKVDFPDAELTVLGRLRANEEPVWLVYWTGEDWQDIDGQPVDVVRWCNLPKGGEV